MKKGLTLFTILVLPALVYLYFSTGIIHADTVPILGPRDSVWTNVDGERVIDTVHYHTIPDFRFQDQQGKWITKADVDGKIYVADFFFTTCKSICPEMTLQLTEVQRKFKGDREVVILSHTVDPEHDNVEVLSDYSDKYDVIDTAWHFLTGPKKELYDIARHGYLVTAMEGDGGPEDFIHSEMLVLVDPIGRIRGMYDGTNKMEVNKLIDDINMLKFERHIPRKKK